MEPTVLVSRIEERLRTLKVSARAASLKATGKPDAIRDIQRHGGATTGTLSDLARALETSTAYLLGETNDPGGKHLVMRDTPAYRAAPSGNNEKIPIMGMAEGGEEGWELWNGEIVGYADRPPNMIGVANAYAAYVVNSSMEPRYFAGELVFVNPSKPVTPGSFVLVQLRPPREGDTPRALIKRLIRQSGSKITLEQYNPKRTFDVQRKDIVSIHRVMGSGE